MHSPSEREKERRREEEETQPKENSVLVDCVLDSVKIELTVCISRAEDI